MEAQTSCFDPVIPKLFNPFPPTETRVTFSNINPILNDTEFHL